MKHRVSVLMRHFRIVLLMMLIPATLWCQGVVLHGNVYEAGSRVPLTGIKIKVKSNRLTEDLREIRVDKGGFFQVVLLPDSEIEVVVENPHFLPFNQRVSTYGKKEGDKVFVSIELGRKTIDRSDDQAHTGHEVERDIADSIEQRTAEYASRINAPHASLKTKSSRRNLAMETGITRQAQKPLDRMSSADERVRLENNMVEILNGQTRNSSNRFRSIPHDYTGYKIQIIKSEYPIDKDEIAGMFPEGIWWEETGKSENTYLIGTFSRFQDAVDYFEEKIASIYPNAKIIEFIRGSRL